MHLHTLAALEKVQPDAPSPSLTWGQVEGALIAAGLAVAIAQESSKLGSPVEADYAQTMAPKANNADLVVLAAPRVRNRSASVR